MLVKVIAVVVVVLVVVLMMRKANGPSSVLSSSFPPAEVSISGLQAISAGPGKFQRCDGSDQVG